MGTGTTNTAAGNTYAGGGLKAYKATTSATMNAAVVQNNVGGQPHGNLMPLGWSVSSLRCLGYIRPGVRGENVWRQNRFLVRFA